MYDDSKNKLSLCPSGRFPNSHVNKYGIQDKINTTHLNLTNSKKNNFIHI